MMDDKQGLAGRGPGGNGRILALLTSTALVAFPVAIGTFGLATPAFAENLVDRAISPLQAAMAQHPLVVCTAAAPAACSAGR